jgi:pimeloyl-ACP methyl ester carboxylesterase
MRVHTERAGLFVTERVAGPDLVLLLHGLGCSSASFTAALDCPALTDATLVAPDLPGHGRTPALPGPHSIEGHAGAVARLLDGYAFDRLHVVAHSMGGAVALVLFRQTGPPTSFVDIEGNLVAEDCGPISRRVASMELAAFLDGGRERLLEAAMSADAGSRRWASMAAQSDGRAFHETAGSLVRWSDGGQLLADFNALPCPRLFVHGGESFAPAPLDRLAAEVEVLCVERAGHGVHEERPGAVYAAVAGLLGCGSAGGAS